jgi:hypothetical protein
MSIKDKLQTKYTSKNRPIGSKAVLNGKQVIWSGEDYGWQSSGSHKQLKKDGQLALGAGLARRIGNLTQRAEQFRHNTFGTISKDSAEGKLADALDRGFQASPLGVLNEGEEIATGAISNRLGISPLIGGLVLGQFVPGPGDGPNVPKRGRFSNDPKPDQNLPTNLGRVPLQRGRTTPPAQSSINKATDAKAKDTQKNLAAIANAAASDNTPRVPLDRPRRGPNTPIHQSDIEANAYRARELNPRNKKTTEISTGDQFTGTPPKVITPPKSGISDRLRARSEANNVQRVTPEPEIDLGGGPLSSIGTRRIYNDNRQSLDQLNDSGDFVSDRFQDGGGFDPYDSDSVNPGTYTYQGQVKGSKPGRPGQAVPLSGNVQLQRLEEVTGINFRQMQPAEREAALWGVVSEKYNVTGNIESSSKRQLIQKFLKDDVLFTDQGIRDRLKKYMGERQFPEQFNQIEAAPFVQDYQPGRVLGKQRDPNTGLQQFEYKNVWDPESQSYVKQLSPRLTREGRPPDTTELKARPTASSKDRSGMKTGDLYYDSNGKPIRDRRRNRDFQYEDRGQVDPRRDEVLGKPNKPREGDKAGGRFNRTQTNIVDRVDNIKGGRRIPQSTTTYGNTTIDGQFVGGATPKPDKQGSLRESTRNTKAYDELPRLARGNTTESSIKSRLENATQRKRAEGMVSFTGKRSQGEIVKFDRTQRAFDRLEGANPNTKLPTAGDVRMSDGRVISKPGNIDQFTKAPKPGDIKLTAEQRLKLNKSEDIKSRFRGAKNISNSRQEFRSIRTEGEFFARNNRDKGTNPMFRNNRPPGQNSTPNNQRINQNSSDTPEHDPRLFQGVDTKRIVSVDGKDVKLKSFLESQEAKRALIESQLAQARKSGDKANIGVYKRELDSIDVNTRTVLADNGIDPKFMEEYFEDFVSSHKPVKEVKNQGMASQSRRDGTQQIGPALPSGSGGTRPATPVRSIKNRVKVDNSKLGGSETSIQASEIIKDNPIDGRDKIVGREISPQDGKYNENPFTNDGEIRGRYVLDETEFLGVNETQVKTHPIKSGRTVGSDRASIKDKLAELRNKSQQTNKNGEPTKAAKNAMRELDSIGTGDSSMMQSIRARRKERAESFVERMKRLRK